MSIMQKVGVIINAHELFHSSKSNIGGTVCYDKLMREIGSGREIVSAVACLFGNPNNQGTFLTLVKSVGLVPKFAGSPENVLDTFVQSMISMARSVDVLVLVTKNDAVGAIIDYLVMTGHCPNIEVWFFGNEISDSLTEDADATRSIDESFLFSKKKIS